MSSLIPYCRGFMHRDYVPSWIACIAVFLMAMLQPLCARGQVVPALEINAASMSNVSGATTASQTFVLQTNTNNSTGNTFTTSVAPISVTFALVNQQFTGYTVAQGFPASTGGNAAVFGGGVSTTSRDLPTDLLQDRLGAVGAPTNAMYTSAGGAAAGTGMDIRANGSAKILLSTRALFLDGVATNARAQMADLTLSFSRAVTNPVLHFTGLGGFFSTQRYTADVELLTPNATLTRLSGNTVFTVNGNEIRNSATAANMNASCGINAGACGSVQVQAADITTLSLRMFLRGTGAGPWAVDSSHPGEGLMVGVSLDVPPRLRLTKALGAMGRVQAQDQFVLSIAETGGSQVTLTTAGAGTTATGTVTVASGDVGRVYTLSESMAAATTTPQGAYASNIACTNATTTGTVLPSGSGNTFTVTARAADDIACTLTNTARPVRFRLSKAWSANSRTGDVAQIGATQRLGTNTAVFTSDAGTATASTPVTALGGQTVQLPAEVMATGSLANYSTTIACDQGVTPSGTNGQASGQTLTVPLTLADNTLVTCTYTNRAHQADLRIFKTNTPGQNGDVDLATDTVTSGTSVTYTIKVDNQGPDTVTGAVVTDVVGAGLRCPADGVVGITGNGVPAGSFSVAQLTGRGITLAALATGQVATLKYTCQVR